MARPSKEMGDNGTMKTKEIDLDLRIDPNRLDRNWLDQPRLYFQYAAELADARKEMDEAKSEVDLVRAELDLAIRSDPETYGVAKVTESAIGATVLSHPKFQRAHQQMLSAKHEVDVLAAAVSALDHRKSALENMVKLCLANYFSSPKATGEAGDTVDEMKKRLVRRGG